MSIHGGLNLQTIKRLIADGVRITYEQTLRDVLAPAWLKGDWSQRWLAVFGAFTELIWQGALQSADVDDVDTCPADALDVNGTERRIDRLPGEVSGTFRNRLRQAFPTWIESARRSGIERGLRAYGLQNVEVFDLASGWTDGNVGHAWRFWVVVRRPHLWYEDILTASEVLTDDDVLGVGGMDQAEYRRLRLLVHKWRGPHASPVSFFLMFADVALTSDVTATRALTMTNGNIVELPITNPPWLYDTHVVGEHDTLGYYIEPH